MPAIARHIRQREAMDCGIAVSAMVANLPYETVYDLNSVKPGSRGMYPGQLHDLLEAATGVSWTRPRYGWLRPVSRYMGSEQSVIVVTRRPWKWTTLHCVLTQQGVVYDPEYDQGFAGEEYPRRHWRVVQVHRPEYPLALLFVQHFRTADRDDCAAACSARTR
jgi:hypothetical protein